MAGYWLCPSLEQFRAELNALYPNRDKRSDGWIGDKYHAASDSDHNPLGWRGNPKKWEGPVLAYDADNDLAVGVNAQPLADYLASQLGKHPALMSGAYLIYNGRIISTDRLAEGWRPYYGKNPHTGHIHISVGRSAAAYNSTAPWGLDGDDDMALDPKRDYEAFKYMLDRALRWDVRENAPGGGAENGLTIWNKLNQIAALASTGTASIDPKDIAAAIADALPDELAAEVVSELAERLKVAK